MALARFSWDPRVLLLVFPLRPADEAQDLAGQLVDLPLVAEGRGVGRGGRLARGDHLLVVVLPPVKARGTLVSWYTSFAYF